MVRLTHLLVWMIVLSVGVPLGRAQQSREDLDGKAPSGVAIQTELLSALNVARLSPGSPVVAKVQVEWKDPSCPLAVGAIITGHVVELIQRSKVNKGSSLTVAFDHAQCGGHETPFKFVLFAFAVQPLFEEGDPMVATGAFMGSGGMPGGGRQPNFVPSTMSFVDREPRMKLPSSLSEGQVIGTKKIMLSVGSSTSGDSVLSEAKGNIHIDEESQMILMATPHEPPVDIAADAAQPVLTEKMSKSEAVAAPVAEPVVAPEVDETSICDASCSMVPTTVGVKSSQASLALSLGSLGFVPHDLRDRTAFSFESTISYLDAGNILFTYDPHKLRQRFPSDLETDSIRTIRAVLLDAATLKVKRMIDWQVEGEGQYIWHVGRGQILVHLGHTLCLMDANLTILQQMPVPGRLLFVSTSPAGERFAVGVFHERHTRQLHDLIASASRRDPEEDVDVQLLDRNFTVLLKTRQGTALPAPVLSDEGEIMVYSAGRYRWEVREFLWNETERTIATVTSECRPSLSTPLAGSVFIVGCDRSLSQNWYRMVRMDGHLVLGGHGSSLDREQTMGCDQGGDFAVRLTRFTPTKLRGERFTKRDMRLQEVSIYRWADGRRVFYAKTPYASLSQQSFAVSPTGKEVAVMSDVAISLYPVVKQDRQ